MTLTELIESSSRKPLSELLREGAHLKLDEERYGEEYCENHCPLEEQRYEGIEAECPGECDEWIRHMEAGYDKVYVADLLIGEVLRNGYETLGIAGINEPFMPDLNTGYAYMDWEEECNEAGVICVKCEKFGTANCPEDILSAECARSGDGWAIERIREAVNEVMR